MKTKERVLDNHHRSPPPVGLTASSPSSRRGSGPSLAYHRLRVMNFDTRPFPSPLSQMAPIWLCIIHPSAFDSSRITIIIITHQSSCLFLTLQSELCILSFTSPSTSSSLFLMGLPGLFSSLALLWSRERSPITRMVSLPRRRIDTPQMGLLVQFLGHLRNVNSIYMTDRKSVV